MAQVTGTTPIPQIQDPVLGTTGPYQLRNAPGQSGAANVYIPPPSRSTEPFLGRYVPGEFEIYVNRLANALPEAPIRRFGANLVTGIQLLSTIPSDVAAGAAGTLTTTPQGAAGTQATSLQPTTAGAPITTATSAFEAQDFNPQVPPDYVVQPGDEIVLTVWGSVDANLRLVVDRTGRISVPRVGAIAVSGVKQSDLNDVIRRRVSQVFKNFEVSASLGQLRGIRVYVAGYVTRPGSMTVSSLSTVVNALIRSGGPSAAGSFRSVQLRRGREVVTSVDLYDLLLKGDRSADRVMQADDVIYIGPVGPQVALIGSVNQPAIFEIKAGETINDLLQMAGGFSTVADTTRLAIERLDDRNTVRITQIELPQGQTALLRNGDVLRAFNSTSVALPVQRQNKRVRVEGEVARPGEYVLPPQSSVADALRAAGGVTAAAYVFGTEFSRESVRVTQQENYERALRDLETEFTKATSTQRTATADEAAAQSARQAGTTRLIERLRAIRPNGRVVLQLLPDSTNLPDLALEDGDRLYIPPRPTTVGVFGSVFNAGSYLYSGSRSVDDYLNLAGGPTKGADQGSVFVVRANGSVVASPQGKGWFNSKQDLATVAAVPGDTVFVPEEINKTTFVQDAKDWTQILYQFGLGIAGLLPIKNY
ncbi:MAG TPA: SLBB domain-containing protein [Burkholderiaceae bacterium]|nr:SLBB domain-containing protein [Burkholderiaceae bacterium]